MRMRLNGMEKFVLPVFLWINLSTILSAHNVEKGFLRGEIPDTWSKTTDNFGQRLVFTSPENTTLTFDNMGYDINTHEAARNHTKENQRFLPSGYKIDGKVSEKNVVVDGKPVPMLYGKATAQDKPGLEWQMLLVPNYRYMGSFGEPSETIELTSFHGITLAKNEKEIQKILQSIKISKEDKFPKKPHSYKQKISFQTPAHWVKIPEPDYGQFRIVSPFSGFIRTAFFEGRNVAASETLIRNGYFKALFKNGYFTIGKEYEFKTQMNKTLRVLEGSGEEIQFTIGGSFNSLSFVLSETPEGTFCLIFFGSLEGGKSVYENILRSVKYLGG